MADIRVTDKEIIKYVRILSSSFGIRKSVSGSTLSKIKSAYDSGLISKCVGEIKSIFGLNLTLVLGLIKSNPTYTGMLKLIKESAPRVGYALCKLPTSEGKGFENTSAFVLIPSNLPIYGTIAFDNFKILLFVFKQITNEPFETFAYCIAHELSHIILEATRHPLRNNEVAVDLTAMILGFSDIVMIGRITKEKCYGYLNNEQFWLAYEEIRKRSKIIYL